MKGGMSAEDRSKSAEIVTSRYEEHCGCQRNSALYARIDMNDIGLNDETDDENMEDGETRFHDGRV